ncbi:hypothetical protein SAMN05444369_1275 [Capnocytophaga haemolytica]|uniref:Transposase n=1 Tax=Capnocytophaga haemolytica TaxID=45243 RepID=A0AAX2H209_9FLAO|nr:hypothetical protein [Capnocytophaga haemolytica]AMD85852.1 hypothetical protein AXF12_10225 [Capnocytophaga haemolytica]SFO34989.1 hypothetical protein SAMN05444369_1275 [Capnocytophaga haemolytica]SNV15580.1 Uncharacterised protein [Capnocytophaga haemolytica]
MRVKNYKIVNENFFDLLDKKKVLIEIIDKYSYNENMIFSSYQWSKDLQMYLFLTYIGNDKMNAAELYVNRFYWFKKFYYDYSKTEGNDVGIEQQITMLLEEMVNDLPNDFDWNVIEEIYNLFP